MTANSSFSSAGFCPEGICLSGFPTAERIAPLVCLEIWMLRAQRRAEVVRCGDGGNTTVPEFEIDSIKRLQWLSPSCQKAVLLQFVNGSG